jgi:hypothetical protein
MFQDKFYWLYVERTSMTMYNMHDGSVLMGA